MNRQPNKPKYRKPAPNQPPYPNVQPPYTGVPAAQVYSARPVQRAKPARSNWKSVGSSCLLSVVAAVLLAILLIFVYLMAPIPTNFLLLGIDRPPEGTTALSRTDTIILVSVNPLMPTVRMLSVPRDLWVSIPDVGENRINTAHFFAESVQPGSGPAAAVRTIEQNFGISMPYYLRLRFDAVTNIVDAMGGVELDLAEDTAGLPAGRHRLDGTQALAFVRDRQGTDDFFRMEHAQIMLRSIAVQLISPASWSRLPQVIITAFNSVDTNIPVWQMPRLGAAFARGALNGGLDTRTISREMTTPFTTEGGADVLLPNWDVIQPMIREMFP